MQPLCISHMHPLCILCIFKPPVTMHKMHEKMYEKQTADTVRPCYCSNRHRERERLWLTICMAISHIGVIWA